MEDVSNQMDIIRSIMKIISMLGLLLCVFIPSQVAEFVNNAVINRLVPCNERSRDIIIMITTLHEILWALETTITESKSSFFHLFKKELSMK